MQGWAVKVVKDDGTEATFPVTPRVIVAFERFHKVGIGKAFTGGINDSTGFTRWLDAHLFEGATLHALGRRL